MKKLFALLIAAMMILSAFAALAENGKLTVPVFTELSYESYFLFRICHKRIQCHYNRHAVFLKILNMLLQVHDTLFKCIHIWCGKLCLRHAAIIFQSSDGGNQYGSSRL